jgi:hypothetical protein
VNATAKNFEAIAKAKERHDRNCDSPAHTLLMHPLDIERLGWEEGDRIAGLTLRSEPTVQPATAEVLCDKNQPSGGEELEETVEAVSEQREPVLV